MTITTTNFSDTNLYSRDRTPSLVQLTGLTAEGSEFAQTFKILKERVSQSEYVFISSIELFYKSKPEFLNTTSGLANPSTYMFICETKNVDGIEVPDINSVIGHGAIRVRQENVEISDDASLATAYTFVTPPLILTNKTYAIVIKFDGNDESYSLWRNRAGETYNEQQAVKSTTGALDGNFFVLTKSTIGGVTFEKFTPQYDVDLKFRLKVKTFVTNPVTFSSVNRDFELINFSGSSLAGSFVGGEYVFANNGVQTGTVSVNTTSKRVTGTGTSFLTLFTNGSPIILKSGGTHSVRFVESITNNTLLFVTNHPPFTNTTANFLATAIGSVYDYRPATDSITLFASSANTTTNFTPNASSNTIVGELSGATAIVKGLYSFPVHEVMPKFIVVTPPGTSANLSLKLATSSYTTGAEIELQNHIKRKVIEYNGFGISRTNEILYGGSLQNDKSINIDLVLDTDNKYITPVLTERDQNLFVYRRVINNDTSNEHTSFGNAQSRYISKRISLADGLNAEDIRVYTTAYRPSGTDIKVYAKFFNELDNELFENKNWTPLELASTPNIYSSATNDNDKIEMVYKLPNWPIANELTKSAGTTYSGRMTGQNANAVLVGTVSTVNSTFAPADLARIYDPLFPNNSLIAVVTASNTTTITIDTTLSTANTRLNPFVRSGLVAEKVTYKNTAFNNYVANGVIRYYNSNMSAFDTYQYFALKVIFLAQNGVSVFPYLDDIRGIACSI